MYSTQQKMTEIDAAQVLRTMPGPPLAALAPSYELHTHTHTNKHHPWTIN